MRTYKPTRLTVTASISYEERLSVNTVHFQRFDRGDTRHLRFRTAEAACIYDIVISAALANGFNLYPIPARQKETKMRDFSKSGEALLKLSPEQYRVTQQNATEPPGTGAYLKTHEPGIYVDIVSGEPLFASSDKFESGCGWPSFTKSIDPAYVSELRDTTHGMVRTEVRSMHADSHLGHVFSDGPRDRGGLRYCINSAALRFIPIDDMAAEGYAAYLNQVEKTK